MAVRDVIERVCTGRGDRVAVEIAVAAEDHARGLPGHEPMDDAGDVPLIDHCRRWDGRAGRRPAHHVVAGERIHRTAANVVDCALVDVEARATVGCEARHACTRIAAVCGAIAAFSLVDDAVATA